VALGGFNTEYGPFWDARPGQSFGNYVFNYTATDSMSGFLNFEEIKWFKFQVVPEPTSLIMVLVGLGLMLLHRRSRELTLVASYEIARRGGNPPRFFYGCSSARDDVLCAGQPHRRPTYHRVAPF
jgi:hypothetical protein